MTDLDVLIKLNQKLDADQANLSQLRTYSLGEQPLSFLSQADRDRLDSRLTALPVNIPRLVVRSIADRLSVSGFTRNGEPDADLLNLWRRNKMMRRGTAAMEDALTYGRSYLLIGNDEGRARISVESPFGVITKHDPATGDVVAAVKRWVDEDAQSAHATLMLPTKIIRYRARGNSFSMTPGSIPVSDWDVVGTADNPLGVVPCVPLINSAYLDDCKGRSAFADVTGLTDALIKSIIDGLTVSEAYARPRRWATGLVLPDAVEEGDEYSEPFDPDDEMLISEEPETRFGSFDAANLQGSEALTRIIIGQISAVTGLPGFLTGLSTSLPPSAEALSVALDGLVGRVRTCQQVFGDGFAEAIAIADTIENGGAVADRLIETAWASPEARSLGASADAAQKLLAAGVDPATVLDKTLGWSGVTVTVPTDKQTQEAMGA
jgi:hypothetical protein